MQICICRVRVEELIDVRSLISKIQSDKQEAIELGVLKKEKKLDDIHKNEIPYSLPDGWEWIRLGDYAFKITDYVASGSFASLKENVLITNEPNYAIMVKTADFSNNFSKNLTYTDEHGYTFLSNSNLFGGELILSNIGSIGKVFIVPNLGVPMTLASNTVMVKMSDKKLIKYLYYFFLSPLGQRTLKNISSGTSMMKFNKTQLKNIIVPIAPLKQQQNIVQLFDRLSILIENQKTQLKLLDELVKARFVEMFGTIRENSHNYPRVTLKEVCHKITDGKHGGCKQEDNSGYYYVGAREIYDGKIHYDTAPQITYDDFSKDYRRCNLEKGDMVIVNTGATIGKSAIASSHLTEKTLLQKSVALIKVNSDIIIAEFLRYCYMVNPSMYMVKSASAQPNLLLSKMNSTIVYLPPIGLQRQFASFVEEVDKSQFVLHQ